MTDWENLSMCKIIFKPGINISDRLLIEFNVPELFIRLDNQNRFTFSRLNPPTDILYLSWGIFLVKEGKF